VGSSEGTEDGWRLGRVDGAAVGISLGAEEGNSDGWPLGTDDGDELGLCDGTDVGRAVGQIETLGFIEGYW